MESIVFIGCGFFLCGCFRAISMSGAGENCFNKDLLMWRCLMKKKEVLGVLAVCGALLVVNPNSVFAADMGVTGQNNGAAVVTEEVEGDGYEIIEGYETVRSKETPCFVSVETICPEGFGLNTYVMLLDDEGKVYRVSISAENGYVGYIYLAPGQYQVTEVSVFNDYKQEYPFRVTEREFSISENENLSLSFKMRDYDQIQGEIANRTATENYGLEGTVLSDEMFYETGLSNVTMQGSGVYYYDVEHRGSGLGVMECVGNATGDYDVVVKIVKSGVIGEAQFQISIDGGKSYIGQDVVADSSKIGDAGLTLYFRTEQDTMEFIEGDAYYLSVPETFPVTASKACGANVIVTGHPMEDHDFTVTILSSGGLGKSRFTVVSTKGKEINITDVLPEDGVYEMEDGLSLVFADSLDYEKGLTYTVTVRSNDDTVDYSPLYVLFGIVVVIGTGLLTVLSGRKEKKGEYYIRRYAWRKDEKDYE